MDSPEERLLEAALPHVAFDGWGDAALKAGAEEIDMPLAEARALFPRGGVDLALAFHRQGDAKMTKAVREADRSQMRYRDRVAFAVRTRIEAIEDKEAARRAATLFALPIYSADGARAIWGTSDAIWTVLGDTSTDGSWYTKRASLSGVYGSTFLFWLGDDSMEASETWAFLDRRIGDVMEVERLKSAARANPLTRVITSAGDMVMSRIKPPKSPSGYPGRRG